MVVWPDVFNCFYCQKQYCGDHSLAENHQCPKVLAAKHVKGDYLRRKGVNITSGRFRIVCSNCGFSSQYYDIEDANQVRIDHIGEKNCPSNSVYLKQHNEDEKSDIEFETNANVSQDVSDIPQWMCDCLNEAKTIINTYHIDFECNEFLAKSTFELFIQTDKEYAFGYITLGRHPYYRIGIHKMLEDNTPENKRVIIIVLVHELLHALHPEWGHDKIRPTENLLANKAGYFDALRNMEIMYLSGKWKLCNN